MINNRHGGKLSECPSADLAQDAHLVGLLRVGGALGHDDQAGAAGAAGHGGDVVPLLPLLHDPLLGQELRAQVIHLHARRTAGQQKRARLRRHGSRCRTRVIRSARVRQATGHDKCCEQ